MAKTKRTDNAEHQPDPDCTFDEMLDWSLNNHGRGYRRLISIARDTMSDVDTSEREYMRNNIEHVIGLLNDDELADGYGFMFELKCLGVLLSEKTLDWLIDHIVEHESSNHIFETMGYLRDVGCGQDRLTNAIVRWSQDGNRAEFVIESARELVMLYHVPVATLFELTCDETWCPEPGQRGAFNWGNVQYKVYRLFCNLLGRKHEPVLSDERYLDVVDAMIAATKASPDPTMSVSDVEKQLEGIPSRLVLERVGALKDAGIDVSACDLCWDGATNACQQERGWLGVVDVVASVLEHGLATWDPEHRRLVFPECTTCHFRRRCDNHSAYGSFGGYISE